MTRTCFIWEPYVGWTRRFENWSEAQPIRHGPPFEIDPAGVEVQITTNTVNLEDGFRAMLDDEGFETFEGWP